MNKRISAAAVFFVLSLRAEIFSVANGKAEVSVDDNGRLVSVKNIVSGTEWTRGGDLWRLYFDRKTADGAFEEKEIVVEASRQKAAVAKKSGRIEIRYDTLAARGETLPIALTLTVTAEESGLVRFSSAIANNAPHTCVRELHYPIVGDLTVTEETELFTTEYGGARRKNPLNAVARPGWSPGYMGPDQLYRQLPLKYPNLTANCFAFWHDGEGAAKTGKSGGLYFGSHDRTFQETWHVMRAWPDDAGAFARLEAGFGKYPNCVCGGVWSCDANVIAPYSGPWTETARFYRNWANTWWDKRPAPDWVKNMTGWQRIIFRHQYGETLFTPHDLTNRIRRAGKETGIDVVLGFGWWRKGMDNGYPDSYFETEPAYGGDAAWKRAISDYRAGGGEFIQYFNGKLIDVESDFYLNGPGKRIAMKDNTGSPLLEQYRFTGSGTFTGFFNTRTFASAKQYAPEWRSVLSNCVLRAIAFGASGVFFDQLGYIERNPDWDASGEFAIPDLCGIAHKAESLRLMRGLIETKGPEGFGLGTEFFTDICMQYADYVHNFVGGADPKDFMDWTRYAFPECILSDREIRDDRPDVAWRVNHNLLIGLRADVEIYRCRGLIDETPKYQAALAAANRLRREHPVVMSGAFKGTDGIVNSNPNSLFANVFVDGDKASVVVTSRHGAKGTIALAGWIPSEPIDIEVGENEAKVLDFTRHPYEKREK